MIRTRDFVLYGVIAAFLFVALGSAIIPSPTANRIATSDTRFSTTELGELGAETTDELAISREARLAEMREKIAAGGELIIFEGEPDAVTDEPESGGELVGVLRCPQYVQFGRVWDIAAHTFSVQEGARILTVSTNQLVGTTTVAREETVAILPIAPIVSPTPNCLQTDVIGFTQAGGLIRNTDFAAYSALSESVLIGYALDGFPIFGPTSETRDQCGGVVTAGLYRYHAATNGEGLLNCFTATPYPFR
jgi:hypothetical protein